LHIPATLQVGAEQVTGFEPTQEPFWQVSVCVQASPSLQIVPFVAATQVAVEAEQTMQAPQADPVFCQVPVASQVCG